MLHFTVEPDGRPLALEPRRLLIAGYTGRDQAAVARHIDELRAHGIPAPAATPAAYALTPDRLTMAATIAVAGTDTSGEAEFVLVLAGGELHIGVGSDHTDRDLERVSVRRSKQVCPKPLSDRLWRWADVRDRWDACELRSWSGGMPYQEGSVTAVLAPAAVLDLLGAGRRCGRQRHLLRDAAAAGGRPPVRRRVCRRAARSGHWPRAALRLHDCRGRRPGLTGGGASRRR